MKVTVENGKKGRKCVNSQSLQYPTKTKMPECCHIKSTHKIGDTKEAAQPEKLDIPNYKLLENT